MFSTLPPPPTSPVLPAPTRRQRTAMGIFALGLGTLLAGGFLPTSARLGELLVQVIPAGPSWLGPLLRLGAFPLLAWGFHLSLRLGRAHQPPSRKGWKAAAESAVLPIVVSALYGALVLPGSVFDDPDPGPFLWLVVAAPLGEEWLFRGWVFGLFQRRWPKMPFTDTNPLPVAVWMSALAFSLWHLQNLATDPVGLVLVQVFYTFWAGTWLGYLRWVTGSLAVPIAAHGAINLAAYAF